MNVFNEELTQEQTNASNNAAANKADVFVEKLLQIQREDGTPKYESVEQALDALKASQEHIRKIETENQTLMARATEADALKQALDEIKGKTMNEGKLDGNTNVNSGLSEEAAAKLIEAKLKEKEELTRLTQNFQTVNDHLIQKFGTPEEASKAVKAKAAELGLTLEQLKNLSASAPNAVLAYFGEAKKAPTSANISTISLPNNPQLEPITAPEKSLLSGPGATTRNQTEFARRIRERVYKEHGIQT